MWGLLPRAVTWSAVQLNQYVGFCFDGLAVDQRGLIAPFLNGFQDRGNKSGATENRLHADHPAGPVDNGGDADKISGTDLRLRKLWINAGEQATDDDLLRSIERPNRMSSRHAHGTLDVQCGRGRFQHALARQTEKSAA